MGYGTVSVDNLLTSNVGLSINGGYVTANVNSLGTGIVPVEQFFSLQTALAGANTTSAQNIFGVGVTLVSSTVYQFETVFCLSKVSGTSPAHTIGMGFGGTSTINNIGYHIQTADGTGTAGTRLTTLSTIFVAVDANTTVTGSLTAGSQVVVFKALGVVSINAGGTFIPQYQLSAAPGGAYTTNVGSYFKISPLAASGSNVNIGTWA
jgi:hypothetical protein